MMMMVVILIIIMVKVNITMKVRVTIRMIMIIYDEEENSFWASSPKNNMFEYCAILYSNTSLLSVLTLMEGEK